MDRSARFAAVDLRQAQAHEAEGEELLHVDHRHLWLQLKHGIGHVIGIVVIIHAGGGRARRVIGIGGEVVVGHIGGWRARPAVLQMSIEQRAVVDIHLAAGATRGRVSAGGGGGNGVIMLELGLLCSAYPLLPHAPLIVLMLHIDPPSLLLRLTSLVLVRQESLLLREDGREVRPRWEGVAQRRSERGAREEGRGRELGR